MSKAGFLRGRSAEGEAMVGCKRAEVERLRGWWGVDVERGRR